MTSLPWTPVKVAWISGVSDVGRHALSDRQRAFVDALPAPRRWKLHTNFPYAPGGSDTALFRARHLLWASTINAARFVAACQPLHRRARLDAWAELKASCDTLLLISLSCGSQIAWSMERCRPDGAEVSMLSLGPVDFGCGYIPRRVVVGAEDRVSPCPGRGDAIRLPGVGHLDYAASGLALDEASQWVEDQLERVQVAP